MVNRYISVKDGSYEKGVQILKEIGSYGSSVSKLPVDLGRMAEVVNYIYENVIFSWYPVLLLFLLCILLNLKRLWIEKSSLFLLVIFLYFGMLFFGTYAYTYGPTSWRAIPDSARRMAMFFMPLMIYYVGLTLNRILKNEKGK